MGNEQAWSMYVEYGPILIYVPDISPLNVMYNGTRRLHGINKGVVYDRLREDDSYLFIESKDIALFSPGRPSLLNFTNEEPDLQEGIYWNCLYVLLLDLSNS